MTPFTSSCFGNPSSSHSFASPCKEAIRIARQQVAELIAAQDFEESILFTSCGTESDNMAIRIALYHYDTSQPKA
jgi:cysteine desulfurase